MYIYIFLPIIGQFFYRKISYVIKNVKYILYISELYKYLLIFFMELTFADKILQKYENISNKDENMNHLSEFLLASLAQ